MTPSDIEVLLHCHTSPSMHPRHSAPAVIQGLMFLNNSGLIKKVEGHEYYTTTQKGSAFIKILCNTPLPLPKQCWVDQNGKIIEGV